MDTKDWVILLTPILCNGIILFIFQKIIDKKIEEQIIQKRKRMLFYEQLFGDLKQAIDMIGQLEIFFLREQYKNGEYIEFSNHISKVYRYTNSFIADKNLKKEIEKLDDLVKGFDSCISRLCGYKTEKLVKSKIRVSDESKKIAKQIKKDGLEVISEKELAIIVEYEREAKQAEKHIYEIKQQLKKLCTKYMK